MYKVKSEARVEELDVICFLFFFIAKEKIEASTKSYLLICMRLLSQTIMHEM